MHSRRRSKPSNAHHAWVVTLLLAAHHGARGFPIRKSFKTACLRRHAVHRIGQCNPAASCLFSSTPGDDTVDKLQVRFEEAMRRRQKRRANGSSAGDNDDVASTQQRDIPSECLEQSMLETSRETAAEPRHDQIRYHQQGESEKKSKKKSKSQPKKFRVERRKLQDGDGIEQKQTSADVESQSSNREGDLFRDSPERGRYTKAPRPKFVWETYGASSVLFPSGSESLRPDAIIHFVGGTFFGSYPRKFYGSLLEKVSCQCNAVVVATSIPLVLPGKNIVNRLGGWMFDDADESERRRRDETKNPLDHISLAQTIQREFNMAYRDVILDEFCFDSADDGKVEDFMQSVPIIGIGHSLGSRIQAVSCSHPRVAQQYLAMGKGQRMIRSGRDGMVYLGFSNWGASESIPGVDTLDATVQNRKREQKDEYFGTGKGRREDTWDERSTRRRRDRYNRYDRYSEDLELSDVFSDVVTSVADGARQISEALTPEPESLEFKPTPDELWRGIVEDTRYHCSSHLVVQFKEDPIDQGSRLARSLLDTRDSEPKTANPSEESESENNVKFARLSGGHLTPVTLKESISRLLPRGAMSVLSSSYNYLLGQLLEDERATRSARQEARQMNDLVDTISSYIASI
ncbi:hypothetical protein THAOC_00624 [Thalassiosira oceanica]|uniref:AB hydrolase-1 domain-containing protein n=1 Tax=Thalassiosira oceanica TaxID=159749 RepID=K0TFL0_THAOC|nr:hypothetical protein THAOC_00624 [Thalassiosira oceanica]|eukprot:EJK77538.1 hypothetical protein THAOC_00624 [Thalassiosira oceanica]